MWNICIKGKPQNISKEECRAWAWASLTVLCYHNLHPINPTLTYHFKKKRLNPEGAIGLAYRDLGLVEIKADIEPQIMFSVILHETIHLCVEFPEGTVEACTSTLVNRFKDDVASLAKVLLDGTYKRAAAIAHCKITYPPKDGVDFYNRSQYDHVAWEGDQYRNKGRKK